MSHTEFIGHSLLSTTHLVKSVQTVSRLNFHRISSIFILRKQKENAAWFMYPYHHHVKSARHQLTDGC